MIFVVDDEMIIAQTLTEILRRSGYAAVPFINPWEALERAKLQSPDLLLTDVWMPDLSGIDLAIKVKTFLPKCKVLLFSGSATTKDLLRSERALKYDFHLLSKPVHPGDLLRELGGILDS